MDEQCKIFSHDNLSKLETDINEWLKKQGSKIAITERLLSRSRYHDVTLVIFYRQVQPAQ